MKLFKYRVISEYNEDKYTKVVDFISNYPYGEKGFEPQEIESRTVFSSKEKAIKDAKDFIQENEVNGLLLLIEPITLDNNNSDYNIIVINLLNNKEYEFSWTEDYNHKERLYNIGDWVYFYSNQRLQIGMVSGEAKGEEPYFIISENNCLSDGQTHDHLDEMWIIKKMDYNEVKKILPYKFLSNIEIRSKLRDIELKEKKIL